MNVGNLSKVTSRALLQIKKYSPEILTVVGTVGVVASSVLAAKATLKLEAIVDQQNFEMQDLKEVKGMTTASGNQVDEKYYLKNKTEIYVRGTVQIVKLYGPSVTLGVASLACIVSAHGIMRRRNVALVAAYKAVESSFSKYRARVIGEFGEEKDRDFRSGISEEKVKEKSTGKTTTVAHVDPNGVSNYARFFDQLNDNWVKNAEYNMLFLKSQQNYANDLLHARGHVFLNDVYDMIGIERSSEGSVVGWVLDKDGDNYVDFNIYNFADHQKRRFVNGDEQSILLDFNVNGVIWDKI